MSKRPAAISIATIAVMIITCAAALAQSAVTQSTDDILRRLQTIEANNAALAKENAALRERLKLSEENAKLRARVSELKDSNQTPAAQQGSTALRHNIPKGALYDKASSPMLVKAPPPAPVPVFTWTGWYVGGNLGASFGHVKTDFNSPVTFTNDIGSGPGSGTFNASGYNVEHPSGFIGGGQIGYNWQYSPLIVVGLEADFQGALERDRNGPVVGTITGFTFTIPPGLPGAPAGSTALAYETKIDWFGTVRGRVGYLWGDGAVLTYVTGGLAYGEVKINGTSAVNGQNNLPFSFAQSFGHSQVNTGWVVGYGMEGKLLIPGWTYKIESLYMDLGTLNTTGPVATLNTTIPGVIGSVTAGAVTTHSHFTDGVLRAGLNYQFH